MIDLLKELRKYDCIDVRTVIVVLYISRKIVLKYLRNIKSKQFKYKIEFY